MVLVTRTDVWWNLMYFLQVEDKDEIHQEINAASFGGTDMDFDDLEFDVQHKKYFQNNKR